MSVNHAALSHHPAPHRDRVAPLSAGFGVIAGPLAWFTEVCAGYALTSGSCVPGMHQPLAGTGWTWPALIALLIVCVLVALAAFAVSYRGYARTREESAGDLEHLLEVGGGRTRFLALWGVLLGAGFALVTALTAIAIGLLPRCAV